MSDTTVFVKVQQKKIDDIIASLTWVSSLPFARKSFAIDRIKQRLLDFLDNIFPEGDDASRVRRENMPHLKSGFRVYDIPGLSNKIGFVLQHRGIKEDRIRTILLSLEKGSRGYYRRPTIINPKSQQGVFVFEPGREGVVDFATKKRVHIPARRGGNYMKRTYQFARELVLQAKPEYFKKVSDSFKRGDKS